MASREEFRMLMFDAYGRAAVMVLRMCYEQIQVFTNKKGAVNEPHAGPA